MEGVEESVRIAATLGKKAKYRVKNDVNVVKEKSKSILEHWDMMRLMDVVWSAKEERPEKYPISNLRPYLIAVGWLFLLFFFYTIYYLDLSADIDDRSLIFYLSIRFGQLISLSISILCLICCFESGLNLVLGGLFMLTVFWSAPPRKKS